MPGSYSHSPAKVLRQALVNNGQGAEPGSYNATTKRYAGSDWPMFYSKLPDDPDALVGIKDTTGTLTNKRMYDGEMGGMQGVQIMVRGTRHDTAYAKAQNISVNLDRICGQEVTIDGSQYVIWNVQRSSDPLDIGYESPTSKRFLFSINATMCIRQQ